MSLLDEYKKKYPNQQPTLDDYRKRSQNPTLSVEKPSVEKTPVVTPAVQNIPFANKYQDEATKTDLIVKNISENKKKQREKERLDSVLNQNATIGMPTDNYVKRSKFRDFISNIFGGSDKEDSVIKMQQKSREFIRDEDFEKIMEKNSFGEGFSSGLLGAASIYRTATSRVGKALGFDEFAKRQEDKAVSDLNLKKIYDAEYREGTTTQDFSTKEKLSSTPVRYVSSLIAESLPSSLAALGAGAAVTTVGAPVAVATGTAVAVGGLISFGSAYQGARESGLSEEEADSIATKIAITTAPLEFFSEFRLLSKLKGPAVTDNIKKSFIKNLTDETVSYSKSFAKQGTLETFTEIPQTVIENAWVKTYDENRQLFDGVKEAALTAFFSGGITDTIVSVSTDLYRNIKNKAAEDMGGTPPPGTGTPPPSVDGKSKKESISISVEETDGKTGEKNGDKKVITFRTTKGGSEVVDIYIDNPSSKNADENGLVWLEQVDLSKAEKKTQTTDKNLIAQRLVNAHENYNYQTEKYEDTSKEEAIYKVEQAIPAIEDAVATGDKHLVETIKTLAEQSGDKALVTQVETAVAKAEEAVKKAEIAQKKIEEYAEQTKPKVKEQKIPQESSPKEKAPVRRAPTITHFTLPENVNSIIENGFDTSKPPVFGTGSLEGGAKTGKAANDVLYFTTDNSRWSSAEVYVGEGKGDISRKVYDYDKQTWVDETNAYKKVNLAPVEAKIAKDTKIMEVDTLPKAKQAIKDSGQNFDKYNMIQQLVTAGRQFGYDIVNIKNPGKGEWSDGTTDKFGNTDLYKTLTGNSGKSDYFVLNKKAIELPEPTQTDKAKKDTTSTYNVGDKVTFTGKEMEIKSILKMKGEDKYQLVDSKGKEIWTNKMGLDSAQTAKGKKITVTSEEVTPETKKKVKINGEEVNRPDQAITKTQLKELLKGLDVKNVEMEVVDVDGKLMMKYDDGKNSVLLRPSALGLIEDNIEVGDTIEIRTDDLKAKGTALRGSVGGVNLASKGAGKIGNFEPVETLKEGTKPFKLHTDILAMAKKFNPNGSIMESKNMPHGAAGVRWGDTGNISTQGLNDLAIMSHELSHTIDIENKITDKLMVKVGESKAGNPIYDQSTSWARKQLTDVYTSFYDGAKNEHPLKTRMREGYATLVQKYVEMPQTMAKEHPTLVKEFLQPGGQFYNATTAAMIAESQRIVADYQKLDAIDKMGARVTDTLTPTNKESFLNPIQKVNYEMTDNISPFEVLNQNLADTARLMGYQINLIQQNIKGSWKVGTKQSDNSYWGIRNGKPVKLETYNWKSVVEEVGKENQNKFGWWLLGRSTHFDYIQLNSLKQQYQDMKLDIVEIQQEGGIVPKEMMEDFKKLEKDYENLKSVLQKDGITEQEAREAYLQGKEMFQKPAEMFDALNKQKIHMLVDAGLMSKQQASEYLSKEGYSSRKRDIYNEIMGDSDIPKFIRVGSTKLSFTIQRTGSSKAVINPLVSAIHDEIEATKKASKQHVINEIGKLGMDPVFQQTFPGIIQRVSLKTQVDQESGKISFPQDKQENVMMARINGTRVPFEVDGLIAQVFNELVTPNNIGTIGRFIQFFGRTFTKGTTGVISTFIFKNPVIDSVTSLAQTQTNYIPIYDQIKNFQKIISNKDSAEAQYAQEYMVFVGNSQTAMGIYDLTPEQQLEWIRGEVSGIEAFAKKVEDKVNWLTVPTQMTEIGTRMMEYINARKAGHSFSRSLEMAGQVSAPFHHKPRFGNQGWIKLWVGNLPYARSAIQVTTKAMQTISNPKTRGRYLLVWATVLAAAVAAQEAGMDDATEEQKDLYEGLYGKELARGIYYPNADGKTLNMVPVSETMGWLSALVNMELMEMAGRTDYKVGDYVQAGSAWVPQQVNPFNGFASWLASILPKPLDVAVGTATNTKFYPAVLPIESQSLQRLPAGMRFNEKTSPVGKWMGEQFNISPVKFDYLITGVLGRAGNAVLGKKSYWDFLSSFQKENYFTSSRNVQEYWKAKKENDQNYAGYKKDPKAFSKEEKVEIIKLHNSLKGIDKLMDDYSDLDIEKYPEQADKLRGKILNKIEDLVPEKEKTSFLNDLLGVKTAHASAVPMNMQPVNTTTFIHQNKPAGIDEIKKQVAFRESGIEVARGRDPYKVVGPTKDLGKYQVSPDTLSDNSMRFLGKKMTPEQFLNSPADQEKFFEKTMEKFQKSFGVKNMDTAMILWHRGFGDISASRIAKLKKNPEVIKYLANKPK